jgi:signal transduction histidine kinase
LDREEKDLLKHHRVYLYRDGIRVYPYGDPDDDWLQVDVIRGTQSARSMFSNDQTVGYVTISQAENPELRDKTNREGLLEAGPATGDLVALIQTVLSYLRAKPYEQYSVANRRARERNMERHRVDRHVEALRKVQRLPTPALRHLDQLASAVQAERELANLQVARTEQLAGVGLSVETASHDLIAAGTEALRLAKHVVAELRLQDLQATPVFAVASSLVSRLEFIVARFQDVQGLFVSTRQKQARIDIFSIVRRVRAMYSGLHNDKGIEFDIDDFAELHAVTTEAAVLQCVINLVDNATYWLMTSPDQPRVIRAFASDSRTLVISDNGPGVKSQDEPFIFEAFYSGKGEDGKGLGLYIAHQNGLRNAFDVELGHVGDERALAGATFLVRFRNLGEKR